MASLEPEGVTTILAEYQLGEIVARYIQFEGTKRCELHLVPQSKRGQIREPRFFIDGRPEIEGLPAKFKPIRADSANSLVQLKLAEDEAGYGFSAGVTMVESHTVAGLEYAGQVLSEQNGITRIETTLRDSARRFHCIHRLIYDHGQRALRASTEFINDGAHTLSLVECPSNNYT